MPMYKPPNAPVLKQFDLSGKVAAVTGGVRGIGLEAARGLAEAGCDAVAVIYTNSKNADDVASKVAAETGKKVRAYKSDVSSKSTIAATLDAVVKDFGRLDVVVANAGVAGNHDALDYTEDEWSEIMKVNLDGAFYTAQAAGKIFKKQGSGSLIITGSVSAILVNVPQKQAAYNASKAAVVHLAKCLAVEWVDFARVNCVSPGFIETDMLDIHPPEYRKKWMDMVPAQRLCDPYELKGAYVFLASNASSYMTGANLVLDGAYTLP